ERDKSEPPDAIKIAIAEYFNVSVDYLLGVTNNPLPLSREEQVVRLPRNFPKKYLPELKNYIDYLMYKSKN
ncbi:MAG TPA: XRE family transcriptional regulator, partial [Candidatus Faecaligallichristensenella faecipullorum]|nr:XRE family transcriptional regulator [Candidatus Faecaligallichristensenella faecipullorum]